MARAQDAPNIAGGEINPYVASSLAQNKQLANSRILTAMQEEGATQRTAMTTSAQLAGQQMQNQAQLQGQAAQMAQDDKRAAEAEVGRREDLEFRKTVSEQTQAYQNEMAALDARKVTLDEMGFELSKSEIEYRNALNELNAVGAMKQAELSTNVALKQLDTFGNIMEAAEKEQTTAMLEKDKFSNQVGRYDFIKTDTLRKIELDKRWDGLVPGVVLPATAREALTVGGQKAYLERVREADPKSVLQTELDSNQVDFSAADATPANIHKIEDLIIDGKVTEVDISNSIGVFDGTSAAISKKLEGLDEKTNKKEYDFWKKQLRDVSSMKEEISKLRFRTERKVKGNDTKSVAAVVLSGLGPSNPTFAPNFGAQILERTKKGMDVKSAIADLKRQIEPTQYMVDYLQPASGDTPVMLKAKTALLNPWIKTYKQLQPQENNVVED